MTTLSGVSIPSEIMWEIFNYFPPADWLEFSKVNKEWQRTIQDNYNWNKGAKQFYPDIPINKEANDIKHELIVRVRAANCALRNAFNISSDNLNVFQFFDKAVLLFSPQKNATIGYRELYHYSLIDNNCVLKTILKKIHPTKIITIIEHTSTFNFENPEIIKYIPHNEYILTPLWLTKAIQENAHRHVEFFLKEGVIPSKKSLSFALKHGNIETIKIIFQSYKEKFARKTGKCINGDHLYHAILSQNEEVVKLAGELESGFTVQSLRLAEKKLMGTHSDLLNYAKKFTRFDIYQPQKRKREIEVIDPPPPLNSEIDQLNWRQEHSNLPGGKRRALARFRG